jgi:hypothetical protein
MITIAGYNFEGPYSLDRIDFNDVAAVYLIVDDLGKNLDVGETDTLKTRIAKHERRDCWLRNAHRKIFVYALLEVDQEKRRIIEKSIRSSFSFPCGQI